MPTAFHTCMCTHKKQIALFSIKFVQCEPRAQGMLLRLMGMHICQGHANQFPHRDLKRACMCIQ
jgi:hypothetical protein